MVPAGRPRSGPQTHLPDAPAVASERGRGCVSRRRAAELSLLFNTVIWGTTFVLVKSALDDISTIVFLALRFGLAALTLLAVFYTPFRAAFSWRSLGAGSLAG